MHSTANCTNCTNCTNCNCTSNCNYNSHLIHYNTLQRHNLGQITKLILICGVDDPPTRAEPVRAEAPAHTYPRLLDLCARIRFLFPFRPQMVPSKGCGLGAMIREIQRFFAQRIIHSNFFQLHFGLCWAAKFN